MILMLEKEFVVEFGPIGLGVLDHYPQDEEIEELIEKGVGRGIANFPPEARVTIRKQYRVEVVTLDDL